MEGCTEEYALHHHQPALNKKPLMHRLGKKKVSHLIIIRARVAYEQPRGPAALA